MSTDDETQAGQAQSTKGVLCPKCDHLNAAGRNTCEYCEAHLYVSCHDCGHRNERVRERCVHCKHRLHRSWFNQWRKRIAGNRGLKISALQIIMLIVGVLVTFGVVIWLAELSLTSSW